MSERVRRYFVRLVDGAVKQVENKNDALARTENGNAISWWGTGSDPELPQNASRVADFSLEGDEYVEIYVADDRGRLGVSSSVRVYGNGFIER